MRAATAPPVVKMPDGLWVQPVPPSNPPLVTISVAQDGPDTVMATVSLSVRVPPVPVLPWSLVTICRLAAPVKLVVGLKLSPDSAVLTSANVPVNVIVASAVPSPTENVSPVKVDSVVAPLVLTSWTCIVPPAASTSVMEIRLPLPVENTLAVFMDVVWAPGTVFTGASLTAATETVLAAVLLLSVPSLTTKLIVRLPVFGVLLVLL